MHKTTYGDAYIGAKVISTARKIGGKYEHLWKVMDDWEYTPPELSFMNQVKD